MSIYDVIDEEKPGVKAEGIFTTVGGAAGKIYSEYLEVANNAFTIRSLVTRLKGAGEVTKDKEVELTKIYNAAVTVAKAAARTAAAAQIALESIKEEGKS